VVRRPCGACNRPYFTALACIRSVAGAYRARAAACRAAGASGSAAPRRTIGRAPSGTPRGARP
jgi:hypothetical protein